MSKKHFLLLFAMLGVLWPCAAQKEPRDQSPVFESKFFSFYNNINLNTHLYLYEKAVHCKLHKTKKDSIALVGAKDTDTPLTDEEMDLVKKTIVFYRDSLLKYSLDGPELTAFSDILVKRDPASETMNALQKKTWKKIDAFKILYLKIHSRKFNRQSADWIMYTKNDFLALEDSMIVQIQKIYAATPFKEKIRVYLTSYAGTVPVYSYKQSSPHIVLDVSHKNNARESGVENVMNQASYLLAGKLIDELQKLQAGDRKKMEPVVSPWTIIEYNTAILLTSQYTRLNKKFTPAYTRYNYAETVPFHKRTIEALDLYWPAYMQGQSTFTETLQKIVSRVREN